MKTVRRHELETNVLAERLAKTVSRVEPYRRVIVVFVLAVLFVAFAYGYMSSNQEQKIQEGWQRYDAAFRSANPEAQMENTISHHGNEAVADWARLWLADNELGKGIDALFVDKSDGKDRLKSARERFTALQNSSNPMLRSRALLGLGRAEESLGRLDEARKAYDELIAKFKNSPEARLAETRRAALEKESTKQFYAWFAEYTPPSVDFSKDPGIPGQRPDFESSLDAPPSGPGITGGDLFRSVKGPTSRVPEDGDKEDTEKPNDEASGAKSSTGDDSPAAEDAPKSDATSGGNAAEGGAAASDESGSK